MDRAIQGHGYAKAPFDAAFWDLLGQSCGQPVWMLMGGKLTDGAPMYRVVPQKSIEETKAELDRHRAAGYRHFQIKVGANWAEDIERIKAAVPLLNPGEKALVDANQGWRVDNAIRVIRATKDLDYILEQALPHLRRMSASARQNRPAHEAGRMHHRPKNGDAHRPRKRRRRRLPKNLKSRRPIESAASARLLHRQRNPRRLRRQLGRRNSDSRRLPLRRLDTRRIPTQLNRPTQLQHRLNRPSPAPRRKPGKLYASDSPGLGVAPDYDSLGDPVARYGKTP